MLSQWEEDHERHFIVLDRRFLDVLEEQIEERTYKKEKEKIKKVRTLESHVHIVVHDPNALQKKDKEEALMFEMTYGSKPNTPVKRCVVLCDVQSC